MIKALSFAFLFAVAGLPTFGQGVFLQEGQSYIFEFSSIPYLQPAASTNKSLVIAWFKPGTFAQNTSALLEIFPNNLSNSSLSASVAMEEAPSGRIGIPYWWLGSGPGNPPAPYFPDLQGVLRVTMISGNAELSGFDVAQIINGNFYSGYFAVPDAVPEPAISTLFAAALIGLVLIKTTRSKPFSFTFEVQGETKRREPAASTHSPLQCASRETIA